MKHPALPIGLLAHRAAAMLLACALAMPAAWAATPSAAVAWVSAAADADIERAMAQARAERKPLLLYWGASWCPPCNQLKATLFNRADFIDRAKSFVAVHIDGDLPGAQQLGTRFKVRGYPTMVLMRADGTEITRLPGEVDAPMVMAVLQLGLAGGRPVAAVLADARAGKPVTGPEWRMLAYYGWDIDEAQLVPAAERPLLLAQLALRCPPTEPQARTRLLLKALAERDAGQGAPPGAATNAAKNVPTNAPTDAALRQRVARLLADPVASRAQMDVLTNQASDITKALAPLPGPQRQALVGAFDAALQRLEADTSLSSADRLGALAARVMLARIDQPADARQPQLPAALVQRVRAHVARDDQQTTDPHERMVVVPAGAWLLGQAGLWADSETLLQANLAKSQSPYYLMSQLGSNAQKLGQTDAALRWYALAFDKSEGPATRLQWGQSYLSALVALAPHDAGRIERLARQLVAEAASDRASFHERSARSLQRMAGKLAEWNQGGQHSAVLQRLHDGPQGLAAVCSKLDAADPQRATCDGVAKALLKKPAAAAG